MMSFVQDGAWTTELLPPRYTTQNYVRLFRDPAFFEPIRNSLWMSAAATAANLVWGLLATFWLKRKTGRLRWFADILIILPWAIPASTWQSRSLESFSRVLAGTIILL